MAFQYKDVVKSNWAVLKRQLPIDDILVSEKLVIQFGPEEIRRIRLCGTLQEKSRNFLLGLLRKPQETFDIFMTVLLELSPALHSQLEAAMAHRNQHLVDQQQQQRQYHEDRIGNDQSKLFDVYAHVTSLMALLARNFYAPHVSYICTTHMYVKQTIPTSHVLQEWYMMLCDATGSPQCCVFRLTVAKTVHRCKGVDSNALYKHTHARYTHSIGKPMLS